MLHPCECGCKEPVIKQHGTKRYYVECSNYLCPLKRGNLVLSETKELAAKVWNESRWQFKNRISPKKEQVYSAGKMKCDSTDSELAILRLLGYGSNRESRVTQDQHP